MLLAATALAGTSPARAQQPSDMAAEIAALRVQVEELRTRLAELEGRSAAAPQPRSAALTSFAVQPQPQPATQATAEEPEVRFRGAPQFTAPGGWSFKPRGRLQYDFGYVSSPPGVVDPGLGFSNEIRRARLGVEGDIPGGFGYTFEIDFAGNEVEITDAILTYDASDAIGLTVGQHNNFQSLEELTSSRFSSFIERAAFTDAFNFERRVGLSGSLSTGDLIVQAGVFTDNIEDLNEDADDAMSLDGRIVFAPSFGETRLHLGGSAHFRDNGDLAAIGNTRYRQRPLIHSTDVRFISTPAFAVEGETSYGLEAALIHGPFHAAAEAHWLDVDAVAPELDPTFFGGYVEFGWFVTGETRGYRGGKFDRTRVSHPVEQGGAGAFQLNVRYDRLDLVSGGIVGGTQDGFMASLIWIPTDYVRFLLNYARLSYDDAVIAAAGGDTSYSVDVVGARAQIDF
jgi:phosphate-selective porin OprO/OprP